jgi:hypothetical protein
MGVLVLGMHRSGTSALTRVLNLLGLDAGRDVLMGASESNPTGHWEVERLTSFNDRLLDELGGRWNAPPPTAREVLALMADGPLGDEAAELHAEAFTDTSWVWKDPRVCLLLPFWRLVLARNDRPEPHVVVALRDPHEVAGSLHARDGMSTAYALALWERYTRTLLADLDGERAYFVPYERLLAEPEAVARDLVAFCDGEPLSDEPDRLAAVAAHLDAGHRHQRATGADDLEGSQEELDEVVLELSGVHDPYERGDLPLETPNLQLAFDEVRRLMAYVEENERLRAGLEEQQEIHKEQVATLVADAEARSSEASALAEQVIAIRAEADDYLRQLEELRSKLPIKAYTRAKGLLSRD